ncbi:MAG: YraN family protein [Thiolinea sp.]
MKTTTREIGLQAEELACRYLQARGLHLLMRNYRLRIGEIDLVFRDQTHVVFVEVRYRKSNQFGGALFSIDARKQQKLIRTAQHYIQQYQVELPVRFDVVAISGQDHIQWLPNAFEAG